MFNFIYRKINIEWFTFFVLLLTIFVTACNKDISPSIAQEFIADDNSFKNYTTWTKIAEKSGKDAALGIFHNVDVNNLVRRVYVKDNAQRKDSEYPIGTIIVKDYVNADGTKADFDPVAMVNRGGPSFNVANNKWEWFRLDRNTGGIAVIDGSIIRGGSLGNNACNSCHIGAKYRDLVFTGKYLNKPN